ncbi:MAG: hypothetical protein IJR87_04855 [Bacteroidaceae bacterium]|nr:hypothetical protein [Bacteroidaceae bacterium]
MMANGRCLNKKVAPKFSFLLNFNYVDLCRDLAKHASMMALAAPSVVTTQQRKCRFSFAFAAPKFGSFGTSHYLCSRKSPCMINTWVKSPQGGFIFNNTITSIT